jgi:hypothetical protein
MNIDPNYEHLSKIFLELLSKNNEFKNAFQAFAPDIYADIESASTNSNCSCRGRVENYVNSNREKCATFYNQLSEEIKSLVNLEEIEEQYRFTNYSGLVKRVKTSEWLSFVETMNTEKAIYRQFSILKVDDENIDVFFV